MGAEAEESAPLVSNTPSAPTAAQAPAAAKVSSTSDRDAIHVTVAEKISAKLSRDGSAKSFEVTGDLQLRISDSTLTKVKLDLEADVGSAQFRTHPNVDKALFADHNAVQLKDPSRGFPVNQSVGVLRWKASAKADEATKLPIAFTVWVNKGSEDTYTITVEYELGGGGPLKDVAVTIPFASSEPVVASFDAVYEVSGDSLDWNIGAVDEENESGSFEFEAQAEDESEFFPMNIRFTKTKPFADIDVSLSSMLPSCNGILLTLPSPGNLRDSVGDERGCVVLKGGQISVGYIRHRLSINRTKMGFISSGLDRAPTFQAVKSD
jgi:hypothetical protein